MIKMARKERKGDRSRSRIAMPREQLVPVFQDGMVVVVVNHESSIRKLLRLGFRQVPEAELKAKPKAQVKPPAPAEATLPAAVDTEPALHDLGVKALRKLAADKGIKGRSKMDRDALIAALK